jgi:hypothetical protein
MGENQGQRAANVYSAIRMKYSIPKYSARVENALKPAILTAPLKKHASLGDSLRATSLIDNGPFVPVQTSDPLSEMKTRKRAGARRRTPFGGRSRVAGGDAPRRRRRCRSAEGLPSKRTPSYRGCTTPKTSFHHKSRRPTSRDEGEGNGVARRGWTKVSI